MLKLKLVDSRTEGEPESGSATHGGTMKVAFATQDMHTLDAHFAGARNIAIYEISPEGHRFLEAVRFDSHSKQDGEHTAEGVDDRITPRVEALEGCAIVFVLAIGGPAAARIVASKVHPVKLPKPEPIADILDRLQTMLNGTPPPWLRKALKTSMAGAAPAFLDEEDA